MFCATMILLSHFSDFSQWFLKMGFYYMKTILKVGLCDILHSRSPRIQSISLSVRLMYLEFAESIIFGKHVKKKSL